MKNIRENIGKNISILRKNNNMTQADIAEKLYVSDKSVSKWEHGDTIPDIEMLLKISELFNVSLDSLVKDKSKKLVEIKKEESNKIARCSLVTSIIWIICTIIFVYSLLNGYDQGKKIWVVFVWGVPASALIVLHFNRRYFKNSLLKMILLSIIVWSFLAGTFITIGVVDKWNVWPIFLIGIPLQIALILWFTTIKIENK